MRQRAADPWRDAQGAPTLVDAPVEETEVDAELGAVHSRLSIRGQVLRRSATRLA
jgi:hypothetical protein